MNRGGGFAPRLRDANADAFILTVPVPLNTEYHRAMKARERLRERLLLSVLPEHVAVQMRQDLGLIDTQFKKIYMSRHENVRTGTPTFSLNLWEGTPDNSKELRNCIGYDVTYSVSITLSTDRSSPRPALDSNIGLDTDPSLVVKLVPLRRLHPQEQTYTLMARNGAESSGCCDVTPRRPPRRPLSERSAPEIRMKFASKID
ncbi:Adenylate cyclase type 6 [Eumeta japonica]|uniref:Adenylate cyclase type 6 n=1 Tax=Eumeta variegata TaxID=151549 RepID=A0A4C1U6K1_EUMVA|nr:Adenylate cyclase type 6 [Eumeta japonica]